MPKETTVKVALTPEMQRNGALDGHSFDLYVTNDGEPEWMLRQLRGWRA